MEIADGYGIGLGACRQHVSWVRGQRTLQQGIWVYHSVLRGVQVILRSNKIFIFYSRTSPLTIHIRRPICPYYSTLSVRLPQSKLSRSTHSHSQPPSNFFKKLSLIMDRLTTQRHLLSNAALSLETLQLKQHLLATLDSIQYLYYYIVALLLWKP